MLYRLKVKKKIVPDVTEHHATKVYWEWRYISMHSLASALDGGEWSASCPGRFTSRERAPGTRYIGGWMIRRNIPSPLPGLQPPIVQPIAQR
jgi:hypothetical protein